MKGSSAPFVWEEEARQGEAHLKLDKEFLVCLYSVSDLVLAVYSDWNILRWLL